MIDRFLIGNSPGEYLEKKIVKELPEFTSILREHKDFYEEIIPHVLFGELTSYAKNLVAIETYKTKNVKNLERVFIFLDNLLGTGDPYLTNLVYVSFLENLSPLEEDYKRLKPFFGPLLLNESKSFERFWGVGT